LFTEVLITEWGLPNFTLDQECPKFRVNFKSS
jgi:hypothetical protein